MRRYLIPSVAILLSCIGAAVPAMATSIDWTTGGTGNVGSTLTYDILTITAKSGLADTDDPLFVAGKTGIIYYGNLGTLNAGSTDYSGLGVQNSAQGGSKGISGDGVDADEALIFSFNNPPGVKASSVKLTLIGLNVDSEINDVVSMYLEFAPLENPSDLIYQSINFGTGDTYLLDFSTLVGVSDQLFGSFAVRATEGQFGVAGIEFGESSPQPVPEPATILLLGTGLVGLAGLKRRFKK